MDRTRRQRPLHQHHACCASLPGEDGLRGSADDANGAFNSRHARLSFWDISIEQGRTRVTRIIRAADRDTKTQPTTNFVGTVYADEVVVGEAPSRMRATRVTFTPGARTNWHSHPVGQTLFCLSGVGRYQLEGDPVQEIHPGDTVIIPPNARHWHGSAPGQLFSHLALSETSAEGGGTEWQEPVSDDDYIRVPAAPPA